MSLYSLRVYREIAWPVSRWGYTSSRPVSFLFYHTNLNIPFNSYIDMKYPSHLMDWNIWFTLSNWYLKHETDNEYTTNSFIIDIVYCYSAHQHVHRTIQADPIVTGVRNKYSTVEIKLWYFSSFVSPIQRPVDTSTDIQRHFDPETLNTFGVEKAEDISYVIDVECYWIFWGYNAWTLLITKSGSRGKSPEAYRTFFYHWNISIDIVRIEFSKSFAILS